MTVDQFFAFLAAGLAVGATVATVLSAVSASRSRKRDRENLSHIDTAAALDSDELETIGLYLVDRLGSTTVASYARDEDVRQELERAMRAVRRYLTVSPYSDSEDAEPGRAGSSEEPGPPEEVHLRTVTDEVDQWNSLARARRDLEIALRSVADAEDDGRSRPRAVGELIGRAVQSDAITEEEAAKLRQALQVANAAIHGYDVSDEQAAAAQEHISGVLRKIPSPLATPPQQSRTRKARKTRYVVQRGADGQWRATREGSREVVATGHTRESVVERTRKYVSHAGGGEVRVRNPDGTIGGRDIIKGSVTPRSDKA